LFIENKGGIKLKETGKFITNSLVISGLLVLLIGILGIIFFFFSAGLMLIVKIIPLEVGIVMLVILGVAINVISNKASVSEDKSKFSLFREIIIIKNLSENLLRNGRFEVVYVKLADDNIRMIGFTTGKIDPATGKIFVFIPTTPVASTGATVLVDKKNIEHCGWTNREALLTVITGGLGS